MRKKQPVPLSFSVIHQHRRCGDWDVTEILAPSFVSFLQYASCEWLTYSRRAVFAVVEKIENNRGRDVAFTEMIG
jgi:hypothetical protein